MENLIKTTRKGSKVILRLNLVFSILAGFILVSADSFIFNSQIIAKITGKLLLPLMIASPVLTVLNIIMMKGNDTKTRSKFFTYTVITSISTLLSILALLAALNFSDGY